MGNTVGTQLTTLKGELGKKIDEAKSRLQESVQDKTDESDTNSKPLENSIAKKEIPKISIYGSTTSTDLLDEEIIDKSLRGDIQISHVNSDDFSDIGGKGDDNKSNTKVAEATYNNNSQTTKNSPHNSNKSNSNKYSENNEDRPSSSSSSEEKVKKKIKRGTLCTDDICFTIAPEAKDVAEYCIPLLQARFCGQTTSGTGSDKADTKDVLNLGLYLKLVDKFLHQFESVEEFTGTEEEYLRLLKLVTLKRKQANENTNQCFQRILADSNRFVKVYHQRGIPSERLHHKKFWGSRQQMLSGKIIADWMDPDGGPLDPIFGVILQPTAGRAGPGDSSWIHSMLFDDTGYMAYHSAVHDAFGYLINFHDVGPGYNYLHNSRIDNKNPLSGQISGVSFWKEVIGDVEKKQKVLAYIDL